MKKDKDKLYFVNYEPRRMLLSTATMTQRVELAHRKLFDWTWSHGHPPPNDAAFLASVAGISRRGWPKVVASLVHHGWRAGRKSFSHPEAMRVLRRAEAAYDLAHERALLGARARWQENAPDAKAKKRLPARPRTRPEPVPINVHCPPAGLPAAPAMPQHEAGIAQAPAQAMPAECLITINDKRFTNNDSRLMNNDSLSVKTAERLTLSGSPQEEPSSEENRFLSTLAETLAGFDPKQAGQELTNWGGWWRLRFREDPAKARRVLAEVGSMIREKRIRTNAGAAAKDLWGRFA